MSAQATQQPSPARSLFPGLLLIVAGVAVYSNTFQVPFLLDDFQRIENNRSLRTLWPPWVTVDNTNRPVGMYTFAVNYALHGHRVWGYHALNLAIHVAAGMLLYGIARHTLLQKRLAARFEKVAGPLALAIAMVWLVHPLQTQAVTYVIQRLESLAALFYLATLYCFVRAQGASRSRGWLAASVACCALGMGTKEVMATAPLLVLWYDRAFVADSWRELFGQRKYYYLALAGTWGVLAWAMLRHTDDYNLGGLIWVRSATPWTYLLTQAGVIAHYLRLCFWPQGQCFDYDWPVAESVWQVALPGALILALLGLTVWGAVRRPALGFLGGWFFAILAPTSSVVPIKDVAFEHRMYLPLAAVAAAAILAAYALLTRLCAACRLASWRAGLLQLVPLLAVVAALGTATYLRNGVYASSWSLWSDVLRESPDNSRAHNNLANALCKLGNAEEAISHFQAALQVNPRYVDAHYNLANVLRRQGNAAEAIFHYEKALEISPGFAEAHNNLASLLFSQGRFDEALAHGREAVRIKPQYVEAHCNVAMVLAARGELDGAITHYRQALEIKPDLTAARGQLGRALYAGGKHREAVAEWREAVRQQPGDVVLADLLARVLATCPEDSVRNGAEAVHLAQRAAELSRGQVPEVFDTLAAAYAEAGRFAEAVPAARRALQLASAQGNKALAEALQGRIKLYQSGTALRESRSSPATPAKGGGDPTPPKQPRQ